MAGCGVLIATGHVMGLEALADFLEEAVPEMDRLVSCCGDFAARRRAAVARAKAAIETADAEERASAVGLLQEALSPSSRVDFPRITEICQRVADRPDEAEQSAAMLWAALSSEVNSIEGHEAPRRQLKALTIAHELLYDDRVLLAFTEQDTTPLKGLESSRPGTLGRAAEEAMRMLAAEVRRRVEEAREKRGTRRHTTWSFTLRRGDGKSPGSSPSGPTQPRLRSSKSMPLEVQCSVLSGAKLEGLGTNLSFSLDTLNLFNILYEMGSPTLTQACSGLLAADVNGKVIHGRNMDYQFLFKMPDETIKDWPDVTFEAYFWKGGRRIFMGIQWPIYIGVHTAMRFNGWSFEQNTRLGMNDPQLNLESAKGGGKPYGFLVRKLMETTPDFETALSKINATSFLAPQYFILAGAKPFEGAVISMDRFSAQNLSATPPVRRFSDSAGPWFLLQTNDDANKFPLDHRRPMTATILAMHGQQDVSINFVWDIVHNFPLKNHMSVFTWVAVPSTNYSQAVLRGEDPVLEEENTVALHDAPETEEVQLLQRFLRRYGAKGRRHVISQEGLRLLET